MNNKNIEEIDFLSLTTEEAEKLGLNAIFEEEDGTYDWIYCMNMMKNTSMMKFIFKVVAICFIPVTAVLLFLSWGSDDFAMMVGILAACFGVVMLITLFSIWFVNTIYKGSYMLVYQMNNDAIMFSQTTDQAAMTRTIAGASAAVNAAGNNIGGVIAGTGLAMSPNVHIAKFAKVSSVRGNRADHLIWVNTFLQSLMIYVPDEFYDFVWNYIRERCDRARISER